MKHLLSFIPAVLLSALVISCNETPIEPEPQPQPDPEPEITLEKESGSLYFDSDAATITVVFNSVLEWTAGVDSGAEWCSVNPASGKGGDAKIDITVNINEDLDERKASVTIKSGEISKTISITQKPSGAILLSPSTVQVGPEGGSYTLVAKASEACTAGVAEDSRQWIKITATKSVSTTIEYTVEENTVPQARTGQIIVSNDNGSETVTVEQAGAVPVINLSKDSFECTDKGGEFSVLVSGNVDVTESVSADWVVSTPVIEGRNYKYTVLTNRTTEERSATVTFSNSTHNVSAVVTIKQAGKKKKEPGSISILAIGNSFSVDAMEYLYPILKQAGYTKIKLGNLYIGGCTLDKHAGNLTNDAAAYEYYVNTDDSWSSTKSFKASDAISSEDWDYISMQQASGSSGMPDTYEPSLTTIISKVMSLCPDAKLMWHQTWAYQQNSSHSEFVNYNNDQMTMYNAIVNAVKTKVMTHSEFEFVIPCGTAIQNLRTSIIGDNLTRDGYHLSYDKGRYVAALMWAKKISGCDLEKISWKPASAAYTNKMEEAIREAVNNAFEHPLEVTKSSIIESEPAAGSLEAIIRAAGYKPDNFERLPITLTYPGYYNSSSNTPMTVQTNMKNFACTRVFDKVEIPTGSLIVQKEGHGYRPEGWVTANKKNTTRPGNVSTCVVEVSEEWWNTYTLRAFNIFKTGATDIGPIFDEISEGFGIFVPKKGYTTNPELEKILKDAGYDTSAYKMLDITITPYRYYNSTNKNQISKPGTDMTQYAATEILPKSKIPNGSIIVIKPGYQYRPEGWTALDALTSGRPGNVNDTITVVDDEWWREFNYRGFNIAESGAPKLDDARQEALKSVFGIFVPAK